MLQLDASHVMQGFLAHLIGGIIGGFAGWSMHAIYSRWQRRRQHTQFERAIEDFAAHLAGMIPKHEMPAVMARVVPMASKATFGTEVPPVPQHFSFPQGTRLDCKYCDRTVEPTTEGRCPLCKLNCSLYHARRGF